jgi:hypothetical protein
MPKVDEVKVKWVDTICRLIQKCHKKGYHSGIKCHVVQYLMELSTIRNEVNVRLESFHDII